MLRLPSYLQKRADTFYLRLVIPKAVRPYWPGREIKHSLNTPHRAQAVRASRALVLYLEGLFEAVAMGALTHTEAKRLLQEFLNTELAKFTRSLEIRGPLSFEEKHTLTERLEAARNTVTWEVPTPYGEKIADDLIAKKGLRVKPSSVEYRRFALSATHMSITLMESLLAKSEALNTFGSPMPPASHPEIQDLAAGDDSLTLSQLIEAYCAEKIREGSWTPKTQYSNRGMYELLLKIVGDLPVTRLDAAAARRYKTILQKLPPNLEKSPAYRDLSIHDVLAMKPKDLMTVTTLNNHLTKVASLFGWAERNGHIERNYFAHLTLRNPQRPDEARAAYTEEDLRKIFSTPQYREHKFLHPHYYWLPLLGLHTGARLNELCQLELNDIRQQDGIWVLDINSNGPGKQLKSKAAKRLIPVHPELLELDLLAFVEQLRQRGESRLFPELPVRRDGASQNASLWFGRYRKSLGLYQQTPKKDFHSFRTTFINTLKQKRLPEPEIATLVGHAIETQTFGRYGKPYTPDVMLAILRQVDFSHVLDNVRPW